MMMLTDLLLGRGLIRSCGDEVNVPGLRVGDISSFRSLYVVNSRREIG
jgi:hypothetical protein